MLDTLLSLRWLNGGKKPKQNLRFPLDKKILFAANNVPRLVQSKRHYAFFKPNTIYMIVLSFTQIKWYWKINRLLLIESELKKNVLKKL